MQAISQQASVSKARRWTSYVLSALPVLFLLFDAGAKIVKASFVVEGTLKVGYPESAIVGLGWVLLVCTLLYAVPQTSVLGAMLLTGYLGGAVATHVRIGDPLFSHVLFPVYFGVMLWGGLYLREERLRALVPFRE
jgi:hypothetical protein